MSSQTIDKKIVQMEFYSDQFQKGVKSTIKAVGDLKQSLDFNSSVRSMDEITKAANKVTLDHIADNAEKVTNRLTTLGGMIKLKFLDKIADGMLNIGKTALTAVPRMIAHGGWSRAMNIENAKFQIKGLGHDWSELSEQINYAVSGTAYGLDAAASAASQLMASGVKFGSFKQRADGTVESLDDMAVALRAISGVAAMTNQSYGDMASIFTTVAGNGRLMSEQLNQLSYRGLNGAVTIADYLNRVNHTSQYTEATVREMVSKGKIDFATFAKAMDDAFGEHAKDANKTLTGALSNIRAQYSKIGEIFASPIIQNLPKPLNAYREALGKFKDALKSSLGETSEGHKAWSGLVNSLTNTSAELIRRSAPAFEKFGILLGKSLSKIFKIVGFFSDHLIGWIDAFDAFVNKYVNKVKEFANSIAIFLEPATKVLITAFSKAFNFDFKHPIASLNNGLKSFKDTMAAFWKSMSQFKNPFEKTFDSIDQVLNSRMYTIRASILAFPKYMKDVFLNLNALKTPDYAKNELGTWLKVRDIFVLLKASATELKYNVQWLLNDSIASSVVRGIGATVKEFAKGISAANKFYVAGFRNYKQYAQAILNEFGKARTSLNVYLGSAKNSLVQFSKNFDPIIKAGRSVNEGFKSFNTDMNRGNRLQYIDGIKAGLTDIDHHFYATRALFFSAGEWTRGRSGLSEAFRFKSIISSMKESREEFKKTGMAAKNLWSMVYTPVSSSSLVEGLTTFSLSLLSGVSGFIHRYISDSIGLLFDSIFKIADSNRLAQKFNSFFSTIVSGFTILYVATEPVRKAMIQVGQAIGYAALKVYEFLKATVLAIPYGRILENIMHVLYVIWQFVEFHVLPPFKELGVAIKDKLVQAFTAAGGAVGIWTKAVTAAKKAVSAFASRVSETIKNSQFLSKVLETGKTVLNNISIVLSGLHRKLINAINSIQIGNSAGKESVDIFGKLKTILTVLVGPFVLVGRAIADFVKQVWKLPAVQELVKNISNALISAFNAIGQKIAELSEKAKTLINEFSQKHAQDGEKALNNINSAIASLTKSATDFRTATANIFGPMIKGTKEVLFNTLRIHKMMLGGALNLNGLGKGVRSGGMIGLPSFGTLFLGGLKGLALQSGNIGLNVGNSFLNGFKLPLLNIKPTFAHTIGFVAIMDMISQIAKAVSVTKLSKSFTEINNSISGFIRSFSGLANGLHGMMDTWGKIRLRKVQNISKLINLASIVAMGLLVKLLADIPPSDVERATIVLGVLVGFVGALGLLANRLGTVQKGMPTANGLAGAGAMIGIALSIGILAIVIKKLKDVDIDESTVEKLLLMVGVIGLMGLIGNKVGKIKNSNWKVILANAVAMYLMAASLKKLSGIKPEQILPAFKAMGICVAAMLALSFAMNKMPGAEKGAFGIIAYVIGLKILADILMDISRNFDFDLVIGNLHKFLLIYGMLFALAAVQRFAGGKSNGKGLGILSLVGSILLMTFAIKIIATLSVGDIVKGIAVMGAMTGMIVAIEKASRYMKKVDVKPMYGLAILVGVVAASLYFLSTIPWDRLLPAAGALGGVLLALSVVMWQMKNLPKVNLSSVVMFGAVIVALIAVTACLKVLSECPWDSLLASAGALGLVLVAIGACVALVSKFGSFNPGALLSFGVVVLGLVAISYALQPLAGFQAQSILAAAAGLSLCLLAVTACVGVLSLLGPLAANAMPGIAGVIAVSIGLLAISAALEPLCKYPADSIMAAAEGLSMTLLAIVGTLAVCTVIGGAAPAAIAGMVVFGAFVAELLGLAVGLGELAEKFPGMMKALDLGIQVSGKLGEFIGAFGGGIMAGLSKGLGEFANQLSKFAEGIQGFISVFQNENTGMLVTNIKNFAEGVKALRDASNGGVFSAGFNWDGFTNGLNQIATGIQSFMVKMAAVNPVDAMMKSQVVKNICDAMAQVPTEGGLFTAGKDYQGFVNGLLKIGAGIVGFYLETLMVKPDIINQMADTTKHLLDVMSQIPTDGGLLGMLKGTQGEGFAAMGTGLQQIGQGVKDFYGEINTIGKDGLALIPQAADVAKQLIETMNQISVDGGAKSVLFGGKKEGFDSMKTGMKSIAEGMFDFVDSLGGIKPDDLSPWFNVIPNLISMLNSLNGENAVPFNAGQAFKDCCIAVGAGVKGWYDQISQIPDLAGAVKSVREVITTIANPDTYVTEIDKAKIIGTNLVDKIKQGVESAAPNIGAPCSAIISMFQTSMANLMGTVQQSGASLTNNFIMGIDSLSATLYSSVSSMGTQAGQKFQSGGGSDAAFHAGINLVGDFIRGINITAQTCYANIAQFAKNCANNLRTANNQAYGLGQDFGQGYANGINSKRSTVWNAAYSIASEACKAAKKAQDSHSPSKVTRKLGVYFGQGYEIGITDQIKAVVNAAKRMADGAIDQIGYTNNAFDNFSMVGSYTPVLNTAGFNASLARMNGAISTQAFRVQDMNATVTTKDELITNGIGHMFKDAMDSLTDRIEKLEDNREYHFELENTMDGYSVGKTVYKYVDKEIRRDKIAQDRRGGIV